MILVDGANEYTQRQIDRQKWRKSGRVCRRKETKSKEPNWQFHGDKICLKFQNLFTRHLVHSKMMATEPDTN